MEDQPNKPAQQPTTTGSDINQVIKNDTNSNINHDVIATTSTQPTTSSTATSLPLTAPSVSSALPPTTTIYQQPPQKPRIIERPPINPYLKISIIRTTNDSVSCLDPNRPGKIKMIFMDQLKQQQLNDGVDKSKVGEGRKDGIAFPGGSHSNTQTSPRKENMIDGLARLHSLPSTTTNNNINNNNTTTSKNKKEIPVPTIKTSSTYNTEIPPTYNIPTSYIRYISPSYTQVNEDVEYNVNGVDELWLFENLDFGPNAQAKIIMPNSGSMNGGNGNEG